MVTPGRNRSFQQRLLTWYGVHGRDLPWRKIRDPYSILVSEILSHQTQISRVVPVYEQLLNRYPTVEQMAAARLSEIKAITDPLGYKVRGKWLHGAALQVADRLGGRFPRTPDGLRELPGVGRYTAGAVMNFAYHVDAPVLDTNVARVLRRHFGLGEMAGRARPASLWQLARAIIPTGKGYLINQALMDLGAMVCRARAPRCDACPLRRSCTYRRSVNRPTSPLPELRRLRAPGSPRGRRAR
ncbi:MAG TPA: A/G-specific adenine glycosylase [Candidatus Dormibacteraeota bacterium]|nr:A/G-specific adenine glycosylase [Candidatus Dormibacteraeota bacterium]